MKKGEGNNKKIFDTMDAFDIGIFAGLGLALIAAIWGLLEMIL